MSANTKSGLVGFFDILGYQNLLERNEPETIAENVLPILIGAAPKVKAEFKGIVREKFSEQKEFLGAQEYLIDSIDWLVFSDTVLLTMEIDDADQDLFGVICWWAFFVVCINIQKELFRAGLPLRGAIDYGKFFLKDTCFAGRTIVNAYQACNELELSACVLCENARSKYMIVEKEIKKLKFEERLGYLVEYLVPLKDREKHMLVLTANVFEEGANIREQVMSSFWANRKDIPRSAREKMNNTEQWLQFLRNYLEKKASKPFFI